MQRLAPSLIILCVVPQSAHCQRQPENSPWTGTTTTVLARGVPGEFDDFAVDNPCILRHHDKWVLLYEGVQIDQFGRRNGFGIATSGDGRNWIKHPQNPLFSPDIETSSTCSALYAASDGKRIIGTMSVRRSPYESSTAERGTRSNWIQFVSSSDGIVWEDSGVTIPGGDIGTGWPLRPSLYYSDRKFHLWWLGRKETEDGLFHTISSGGVQWSRANFVSASKLEEDAEICCARVYSSDAYFIMTYVVREGGSRSYQLVTAISRGGSTWKRQGPPPFALGEHHRHSAPFMQFTPEGAWLYYSAQLEDGGSELRKAFCAKADFTK